MAYLTKANGSAPKKSKRSFRMSNSEFKPVSFSGAGAALPFPPPDMQLICPQANGSAHSPRGTIFSVAGWAKVVKIHPIQLLVLRC